LTVVLLIAMTLVLGLFAGLVAVIGARALVGLFLGSMSGALIGMAVGGVDGLFYGTTIGAGGGVLLSRVWR
jgi:hypothetical protein